MHDIENLLRTMQNVVAQCPPPLIVAVVAKYDKDPFAILIACLLSLRARDKVTGDVVQNLFALARTPRALCDCSIEQLRAVIRPLGMYRKKAEIVHAVSCCLLRDFFGTVPATREELLSLPGVGEKTVNLVLSEAFDQDTICVDTHVHRIARHLGLVPGGATVGQTQKILEEKVPKYLWRSVNRILVPWGQCICRTGRSMCVCRKVLREHGYAWD